jgi:hypothetical protein
MDFPTMALNFTSTAAGSTTTIVCNALNTSVNDLYVDRAVVFKGGSLDAKVVFIEDYVASEATLDITDCGNTVASGQEFFIL